MHDLVDELQRLGARAVAATADVADADAVAAFVEQAVAELGGVDLVVNNAGVVRATSPATDSLAQAVDDFEWMVGVNLRGTYLVGRAAMPHLVAADGPADIVNVTTDHIHTCGYPIALDHGDGGECPWAAAPRPPLGGPGFDVYDASKWAIKGLTFTWAQALAKHGVRVNGFGMGATNTPMYRSHLGDRPVPPTTMAPEQVAAVLVDLVAEGPEGRTGDSIELWVGHPCALPPVGLDGTLMAGARAKLARQP